MGSNRRLAAIVFADMVGYTAMVQEDEQKARSKRDQLRKSLQDHHEKFDGQIVQYYGDGSLSIFSSAVNAVRCAIAIQRDIQPDPDLNLRIGIHLGDIILDSEGAFGDGVNLASRIENLSIPGAVLLSDKVQHEISNQSDLRTRSLGIFQLRNVTQPVEVFAVDHPDLIVPDRSMLPNVKDQFISSVAVLPFLNLSSDPENQYFSDGVAEEILNALTAIHGLKVIARTSSFLFRSTDLDIKEIGNKLQVKNVLQGSVRRTDRRIRVMVQLINTVDGSQIFSEKYDGDIGNIFEIQDEIARKVMGRLRVLFTESPRSNIKQNKTRNLSAYSEYLQGLHYMNHLTTDSFLKAIAAFQRARHLEPSYTAAYAMEAWSTAGLVLWGVRRLDEGCKDIEHLLGQAHNLDPKDPQYLGVKAAYHLMLDWNWPAAREALDQGLALHPNTPEILMHDSLYELVMGNYAAAIVKMEKVVSTNPLSLLMQVNLAIMYLCDNQLDMAEAFIEKALEIDPNFRTALENKGWILALKGQRDSAISIFETMETFGYRYTKWSSLGSAYAMGGLLGQAQNCLENLEDLITPENEVMLYLDLALLHSWMGNMEEAFNFVQASFEKRKMESFDVMHIPIWQKIWEHPQIGALAAAYELPSPDQKSWTVR